jgi:hypothetical protein
LLPRKTPPVTPCFNRPAVFFGASEGFCAASAIPAPASVGKKVRLFIGVVLPTMILRQHSLGVIKTGGRQVNYSDLKPSYIRFLIDFAPLNLVY